MRPSPSPALRDWVSRQAAGDLYTTGITVAEIRCGLERLPGGRRKDRLQAAADEVFAAFSEYVLPFDAGAAVHYARIARHRDEAGLPIGGSTPRSLPYAVPTGRPWPPATSRISWRPALR
jgi:predicted nucleic acid-binding protein